MKDINDEGIYPTEIPTIEDVIVPVDISSLIEELEQKINQSDARI